MNLLTLYKKTSIVYLLMTLALAGCGSCAKSQAAEPPDNHFSYTHDGFYGFAGHLREFRDEEHKTTCYTVWHSEGISISCLRDQ